MEREKILKSYAVIQAGLIGENMLESYFPYFANIIYQNKYKYIDEEELKHDFKEKYFIDVPSTFIRQVLSVGIKNELIIYYKGRYEANLCKFENLCFDEVKFEQSWSALIDKFTEILNKQNVYFEKDFIENSIIKFIDEQDQHVILNNIDKEKITDTKFDFYWYKFLLDEQRNLDDSEIYDFVSGLCAGNLVKDALFFAGENGSSYVGLSVYLDSPMIFALLGLDTIAREESYKLLVEEMINAGCKVLIFDHNLEEVLGILNGAAGWALGDRYDMSKANNAAKYFHDSGMNRQEIYEFIDDVEAKLNIRGISVSIGEYNKIENEFQAAEEEIYEMIESRYKSNNAGFDSAEHEHKIRVDVRSIVMVYRKRAGNVSSTIQTSHHVMITTNGTIANICREYQNTLRLESAHIPACISTDLFGTILWLQRPAKLIDYQKKRLLADCYCALQPNKKMIDLFLKSLEKAYKDEKIDESKFYFLRAHPIVRESLMNVTKGDYALFNDRTWIEVYDEIQKKADNKFKTEVFVHEQTRIELEIERKKNHALNEKIEKDRQIRKEKFNNNAIKLGWFFTAIFCGLPYILLLSIFEIAKSAYNQINFDSVVNVIGLLLVTGILAILFRKGKKFCFQCASKILTKYSKTEEIFLD